MKKYLSIVLALLMCFPLAACGGSETDDSQQPSDAPVGEESEEPEAKPEAAKEPQVEIAYENLHIFEDSLGDTTALYLCEIKNTGEVPVKIDDVSIDTEDAAGTLLTTTDYISAYPDVIAPGKSAYICEEVIGSLDTDVDASTAEKAVLHYDIEEKEFYPISAEITQATLGEKMTFPNLTGKVKNTGSEDLTMVYVSVPVFSAEGTLQTVIFTIVDELAPGEEKGFEQMAIFSDLNMDYSGSSLGEISVYTPTLF